MPKEYLTLKQDDCRNCYRCIRYCPVKAISFSDSRARIVDSECVLCGICFLTCPQQAKEILNDVPQVKALIASGAPVYASLAPSFVAYFDGSGLEAVEAALRKLGFAGAEETALGATQVKKRYDEMIAEGKQSVIISSCCHSITLLLQKHFPEVLPCLAPVLSPMQAHCLDIKKRRPEARTVFIGPCVSKKAEADQFPGTVDCVLTFGELSEWLQQENVMVEHGASARSVDGRGKARLFPTTGGILRTMTRPGKEYRYLAIDGVTNCIKAVQDIMCGTLEKCFIEMSACSGSCVGGPGMGRSRRAPVTGFLAVEDYAGEKDFKVSAPRDDELEKQFVSAPQCRIRVSEAAIKEVLRKTGKTRPEHELNCGTCGYPSCRDKAAAVVRGKADIAMCLPFLKEKAESFSDTIITNTPNGVVVLNEQLVVQLLNESACRLLNVKDSHDLVGSKVSRVLDPDVFVEVITEKRNIYDRHAYLAEYQRHVRQTVVHDANFHIIILIMRDVTAEETARGVSEALNRTTVEITDQVIEKQMRVVQEIASLLGETAAETKIALTKLKESLDLD